VKKEVKRGNILKVEDEVSGGEVPGRALGGGGASTSRTADEVGERKVGEGGGADGRKCIKK